MNRWPNALPTAFSCAVCFLLGCSALSLAAAEPDYSVVDPALKIVPIDSDPKESFLGMQLDTTGRLFVGGREALFVYEPKPGGGYQPRRELYRFPNHTWIYDIAIRGNDLYVLTVSALYLIKDGVTQRDGLRPKRLVWGIPLGHVHQCFHGLAIGPEGDIYFQSGDPLWYYGDFSRPDHWGHWTFFTQPEGTQVPFTGVGGVMRCRPDGSGFQVVSRGQRNSCGLAFDAEWNLFSNDNDHEGMPAEYVPGRLLHITPKAYFNWPRGWLLEKHPERADVLETMNPKLGRYVPVGQAYYNDTLLPEKYHNNLLVTRWDSRAVPRYPLRHHGATFKADEVPMLVGKNDARPVSVTVGRGGRIFVTISYMAHNDASPTYRSDLVMITRADDNPEMPFDAYEATQAKPEKLWAELSDPSWSRRYQAHIEIQRRGEGLLDEALKRLQAAQLGDPAVPHLIWLAASARSLQAAVLISRILKSADENHRVQSLRALTEFFQSPPPPNSLTDASARFQHAAVLALFNQPTAALEPVIAGPALSRDTYIRQAATLLLAEKATAEQLREMCVATNTATRLAGVLATGFRLTLPPATQPLAPNLRLDASRTNEYLIPFEEGVVDLRLLGRVGNFAVADHWNHGPGTAEQEPLFDLLLKRLEDSDEQVRLQAAHFLYLLDDKRAEPLVAKVCAQSEERKLEVSGIRKQITEVWLAGPFSDGTNAFAAVHSPETGPVDLMKTSPQGNKSIAWKRTRQRGRLYNFVELLGPCDQSSFYAYFRLESATAQLALLLLGSDDGVKVWHNGKPVWTNEVNRAALPYQDVVKLKLLPGGNDLLVRVQNQSGACGLYLDYRALGDVPVTLPDAMSSFSLAERMRLGMTAAEKAAVGVEFTMFDWAKEAAKGDTDRGEKLFTSLACSKCHAVKPDAASGGGPSLAEARNRFSVSYLVESILLPSKVISPVFRGTLLELNDGEATSGLIVGETAAKIELLLGDGSRKAIEKSAIKSRQFQDRSPMPEGLVRAPNELRDLLAYILSEQP